MFEVTWLLFIVASLVLIVTPGQDMILVMSRSIARGSAAGVATAAGVSVGLAVAAVSRRRAVQDFQPENSRLLLRVPAAVCPARRHTSHAVDLCPRTRLRRPDLPGQRSGRPGGGPSVGRASFPPGSDRLAPSHQRGSTHRLWPQARIRTPGIMAGETAQLQRRAFNAMIKNRLVPTPCQFTA